MDDKNYNDDDSQTPITRIVPEPAYIDDAGDPWEPQRLEYACPCCGKPTCLIVGDSCCAPYEGEFILENWDGAWPRPCRNCEQAALAVN
jgi:hypothetical protein